MLFLVTHCVDVPSSRVPLAMIILNDAVKRKSLPPTLKCRMVIPSCGNYSSSLWEADTAEELQQWVDGNLMDGTATVAEVPEEFTYGLSLELTTVRAAEKVATSSKSTIERINTTGARVIESMAEKLDRLDQRTNLITATREATSAAVGKVKQATDRALESEGVQKSLASISSSLQTASNRVGKAFSWVGSKVKESFPASSGSQSYTAFSGESSSGTAGLYDGAYSAPAPYMPVSTNAARPSGDVRDVAGGGTAWGTGAGAPAEEATPMPHFTLQDEGFSSPDMTPSKDFGAGLERAGATSAEETVGKGLPLMRAAQDSSAEEETLISPPVSAPAAVL